MNQPKDTPENHTPTMTQDDEYTAAALDRRGARHIA